MGRLEKNRPQMDIRCFEGRWMKGQAGEGYAE